MKILKTAGYEKLAKKKDWDPNPWAICHTSVDKDKDPAKYEKCVHDVKGNQKKSQFEGQVYTPEVEDPFAQQQSNLYKKRKQLGFGPVKRKGPSRLNVRRNVGKVKQDMNDLEWKRFLKQKLKATEPVSAQDEKEITEAKKNK